MAWFTNSRDLAKRNWGRNKCDLHGHNGADCIIKLEWRRFSQNNAKIRYDYRFRLLK